MHELALARSLVEMVDDYAADHNASHVKRVNLRLGKMSAMTRALAICFESVSRGTACEGAELSIEEISLTVFCSYCDKVNQPSGPYSFRCSDCGMPTPKVVTGREMQLVSIELATEPTNWPRNLQDDRVVYTASG
ncbi:MAG: hydrogenase maturation nickel metallochaperone HypA [Gammaproteobacteria bacterium]|nr:hydrogenase maturation nickel metallochaperone HypA [Gammaproteobacteria bacterium]MCY4218014.1 hydrogenase maturation nickel metallochaperone HypA [Gammaproteobacteria bacterium]MCY4274413.1 hydrogenase maturation nickel metallochaperone HypA [Gammaproteobacteria bacterium]